jgi:hypothetical protein
MSSRNIGALTLFHVKPQDVDRAWRDGASRLGDACRWAPREITADQLKMLCARGERVLLGLQDGGGVWRGWLAVGAQQLPNLRVLMVYSLAGDGVATPEGLALVRAFARDNGCTTIRGCMRPSMVRLIRKLGGKPLYQTVELEVDS